MRPDWLATGTKVFYKDPSGLICSYVETKDALYARQYVDDLVPNVNRTACLSIVREDHEAEEIPN